MFNSQLKLSDLSGGRPPQICVAVARSHGGGGESTSPYIPRTNCTVSLRYIHRNIDSSKLAHTSFSYHIPGVSGLDNIKPSSFSYLMPE